MDKRINYIIGLDTETANGILTDDKLDLSQSLVYDLGWVVTDRRGRIYEKKSFVIREVFVEMKDLMRSAYYAEKIPTYWEEIKSGERKLANFQTIRREFLKDAEKYGVNQFFAHNACFDLNALNNTIRYITKSKYRYFFPYGSEIWDTLKMARQTIGKQKSYRAYCIDNSYMTKHKVPQVRLTAEILYRYISGDNEFSESHTGLEDVLIETKILVQCFRQHKKMDKCLFN
jgi:DNA polymerase III epsilon subunit-like protein